MTYKEIWSVVRKIIFGWGGLKFVRTGEKRGICFYLFVSLGSPGKNGGRGSVCSLLMVLWCIVKFAQLCPTLSDPKEFSRQEYGSWSCFPSPGHLPNPLIEPGSLTLQVDSLPAEPLGKSENTGVGSLSILQGIFPTQESNWGLPHCRWILYQLSFQYIKGP